MLLCVFVMLDANVAKESVLSIHVAILRVQNFQEGRKPPSTPYLSVQALTKMFTFNMAGEILKGGGPESLHTCGAIGELSYRDP